MKINSYILNILNKFKEIGDSLVANRIELQIKQKCDCNGHFYWQIYDPVSGYHTSFGSEQDVRAWIEEYYYHS